MKSKKYLRPILSLFIILGFLFVISEIGLRILGFKPDYLAKGPSIRIEPEGGMVQPDTFIGYGNKPGKYYVHFTSDYFCICTNDSNGFRITRAIDDNQKYICKPAVWILGCSNTYGWSLNDWETYPYRLQSMNPEIDVVNYGVNGYGTIQGLLQLERDLKQKPPPKIVIMAYGSLHDGRNTMNATRRKAATVYNFLGPLVQPYASVDKNDSLIIYKPIIIYNRVPLSKHSALIHFVERGVNTITSSFSNSHKISQAILLKMNEICRSRQIVFIVAGIAADKKTYQMLDFCSEHGIPAIDISVSNTSGVFCNYPYDGHPNPIANSYYARKLHQFLHQRGYLPFTP
ncbi:MAG: SGNH/GDSL hydrolase family protein [bacterium]